MPALGRSSSSASRIASRVSGAADQVETALHAGEFGIVCAQAHGEVLDRAGLATARRRAA